MCELAGAAESAPVADELAWLFVGSGAVSLLPCNLDQSHDGVRARLRRQNPHARLVLDGGQYRVPGGHGVLLEVEQSGLLRGEGYADPLTAGPPGIPSPVPAGPLRVWRLSACTGFQVVGVDGVTYLLPDPVALKRNST